MQSIRKKIRGFLETSETLGPILLALVVGLAGGVGALFFRLLIGSIGDLFQFSAKTSLGFLGPIYVIFLPAIGLVLVVWLVKRYAPEARGHGVPEVMYAVRRRGGRIRARVAGVKALASAICIGSGGSVGREGPIVQIGSSLGSTLGQILGLRQEQVKVLLACGAAAGVGGTFNAPIAGVFFAMEVILGSFAAKSFGMVVMASVTSTALVQSFLGRAPAFPLTEVFTLTSSVELIFYMGLGVFSGVVSVTYVRVLYFMEDLFDRARGSALLKALVGGLLVGILGYGGIALEWPYLYGVGYEGIEHVLALGQNPSVDPTHLASITLVTLLLMVVAKMLATSLTLAAGGSGGVFAPALFIGAMAGGAFGVVVHTIFPEITAPPGAYALVGMGAVFAGAAWAPVTSILILFEMTDDYQIILPLMMAVVIAYLISSSLNPDSIYSVKLRRLGGLSPQLPEGEALDVALVADAMNPDFDIVTPEVPLAALVSKFQESKLRSVAVVDSVHGFEGLVTAQSMGNALLSGHFVGRTAHDVMSHSAITCVPNETLRAVLQRLADKDVQKIPVVDSKDPTKLLGILHREEVLWAYGEMAEEHQRLVSQMSMELPTPQEESIQIVIEVRSEHKVLCFKHLREVEMPEGCLIAVLRRGERSIVPGGETVIEPGDVLLALATRAREEALRKWVSGLGGS